MGEKHMMPLFRDYAYKWFELSRVDWRESQQDKVKNLMERHLIPRLGDRFVNSIKKTDISTLQQTLLTSGGTRNKELSVGSVNSIMVPLRQILTSAAKDYGFDNPFDGVKPLKQLKTGSSIDPFTKEEVERFLQTVKPNYKNYYTVRFYTGMTTGEIDGLTWDCVNLSARTINIKNVLVDGVLREISDGSDRVIGMSDEVLDALSKQFESKSTIKNGNIDYVFTSRSGSPLDRSNVIKRVWHPTLEEAGLRKRAAHQTKYTAGVLWLKEGKSPEWVAKQLGYKDERMLLRAYNRFLD